MSQRLLEASLELHSWLAENWGGTVAVDGTNLVLAEFAEAVAMAELEQPKPPTAEPLGEILGVVATHPDRALKANMHGRLVELSLNNSRSGQCSDCNSEPTLLVVELEGKSRAWFWCGYCDIGG